MWGLTALTPPHCDTRRRPRRTPRRRFSDWIGVTEKHLDSSLTAHNSEEALFRDRQRAWTGKRARKNNGHPIGTLPGRTGRVVPASPFLLPFPAGLDERSCESSTFLNVGHEGIAAETAGNGDRVPDVLDKEIAKIPVE